MSPRDQLIEDLRKIGACDASLNWLERQSPETTLPEVWALCKSDSWKDWLLLASGLGPNEPCPSSIPSPCTGGCGFSGGNCECDEEELCEWCDQPIDECECDDCDRCGRNVDDCWCDEDEDESCSLCGLPDIDCACGTDGELGPDSDLPSRTTPLEEPYPGPPLPPSPEDVVAAPTDPPTPVPDERT